jgi:hypothetical protein
MNSISTNFRFFIENDINPFIIFDHNGKIIYLNSASEVLLGYVSRQELYDITLSYAPKDFGFKTTRLDLQYDSFSFYAFSVAYENEDEIALHLYHKPRIEAKRLIEMDRYNTTDINTLLEANISLFKLQNDNDLTLLVDQDLPPFKLDQNQFSKLLRKVLDAFRSSDSIAISLKLLIGEYIIIQDKREHLIELTVRANGRYVDSDEMIGDISKLNHIITLFEEHSIRLQIPFIR